MTNLSGLLLNFSGIKSLASGAVYSKIPFRSHKHDTNSFCKFHCGIASASRRMTQIQNIQKLHSHRRSSGKTHALSAGRNYELNRDDGFHTEPFWLNMIREAIWSTRNLLQFLVEQPSQLKYIEWPSFQSTAKTAMLTLVLVALLIISLSSVDSALSYLLSLFLRRKP